MVLWLYAEGRRYDISQSSSWWLLLDAFGGHFSGGFSGCFSLDVKYSSLGSALPEEGMRMTTSYRNPYRNGKCSFVFVDDCLAIGEAALAADWIAAWKTLRGGCASSRLDHGFSIKLPWQEEQLQVRSTESVRKKSAIARSGWL